MPIDSLEYYHNRDNHGNLRTQEEPQPVDKPFDELLCDTHYEDHPDDFFEDLPIEDNDEEIDDDSEFDSGRTDKELEEN